MERYKCKIGHTLLQNKFAMHTYTLLVLPNFNVCSFWVENYTKIEFIFVDVDIARACLLHNFVTFVVYDILFLLAGKQIMNSKDVLCFENNSSLRFVGLEMSPGAEWS